MAKLRIQSVQLDVNNSGDETRDYDISCTVRVRDGKVTNIDSGQVMKDGISMADFNGFDETFNSTFRNLSVEERYHVTSLIGSFVTEASAFALENLE